jgi:hypothetical protein
MDEMCAVFPEAIKEKSNEIPPRKSAIISR